MSEKAISKGDSFFPLISAADAGVANVSAEQAILCKPSTLDPSKAKGKILVCLRGENARVEKGEQCALAGAVGMILANSKEESFETLADPHLLPASDIDYRSGLQVFHYINSTRSPQAYITHPRSQLYTEESAPRIAAFSAKGPNEIVNEILKPDIVAPGVNIIAAFTEENSPTESKYDARRIPYNVMSGTSMSCPHVAGVAGLLKRLHPDWSPAAIRSALMTTATTWDNKLGPILNASKLKATPLELGAGHIRPSKAMDPGLVYDLTRSDYLNLLCARGYNQRQLSIFSKGPYTCPRLPINPINFNYPSITIPNLSGSVTVTRTVKNVGSSQSYYNVAVKEPIGISVLVTPQVLAFETMGEEKTFRVTFTVQNPATAPMKYLFGELNWRDSTHNVTSPLVVRPT